MLNFTARAPEGLKVFDYAGFNQYLEPAAKKYPPPHAKIRISTAAHFDVWCCPPPFIPVAHRGTPMQIEARKVVILNYTLTDSNGNVIDQSNDSSFAYLHGANNIIPGLENALTGKSAGDALDVSVEPAEGYGERDPAKTQAVPRDMFPDDAEIEVGMQFHAQGPNNETLVVTVVEVEDDTVTVDGNHPLAGIQLNFTVEVMEVRDASQEELDHGHVHGPGAHDH
jgi:FKBP-type peptidyl-prolyl cis-trans isomerase SlyD